MTDKGKMIEAVYRASLTQRATLVVFYLINRANKDMVCFPGIKTIASDCNMSDRTVRRAIDDLTAVGFVKKEARYRENGGQSSNLYTLCFENENQVDEKKATISTVECNAESKVEKIAQVEIIDFESYGIDNRDNLIEPILLFRLGKVENNNENSKSFNCVSVMCQGEDVNLIPP